MRQAIESIRAVEGNQGPFHRLGEALRLIWQAEKISPRGNERNSWTKRVLTSTAWKRCVRNGRRCTPPAPRLKRWPIARIRCGKTCSQAINLGENNPAVIREYVELLLRDSPDDEANRREAARVLKRVSEPLLVNSELGRLAATVAADRNDVAASQGAAGKNRRRQTPQTITALLLWEGLLLAETNNPEAEKTAASRRGSGQAAKPEAYVVLVQYLARQKREKDADAVLEQAQQAAAGRVGRVDAGTLLRSPRAAKSRRRRGYEEALNGHRQGCGRGAPRGRLLLERQQIRRGRAAAARHRRETRQETLGRGRQLGALAPGAGAGQRHRLWPVPRGAGIWWD